MRPAEFEARGSESVRVFRTLVFAGPGDMDPKTAAEWLYVVSVDLLDALRVGIRSETPQTRTAVDMLLNDVLEVQKAATYAVQKGAQVTVRPKFKPGDPMDLDHGDALRDLAIVTTRIPFECEGNGGDDPVTLARLSDLSDLLLAHLRAVGRDEHDQEPEEYAA